MPTEDPRPRVLRRPFPQAGGIDLDSGLGSASYDLLLWPARAGPVTVRQGGIRGVAHTSAGLGTEQPLFTTPYPGSPRHPVQPGVDLRGDKGCRQERGLASWVKDGQPVAPMFRFLFNVTGQRDCAGRWRPSTNRVFSTSHGVRFVFGCRPFLAAFLLPLFVVGPVESPPCNLQRPLL